MVGAVRSVPARHLAAGPPQAGIEKKGNCAPVCADPVDLQGRLGCGALGARALGREQEGPSDSPSRAPPPASLSRALDSELEALHGCTQISDATDLNQAPAANFSSAGGSTLGMAPKRCCLSRAHLIMGPSALEVCGCNYVAAE